MSIHRLLYICVLSMFSLAVERRIPVSVMIEIAMKVSQIYHTKCFEILIHKNMTLLELRTAFAFFKYLSSVRITQIYDMDEYLKDVREEATLSETKCFRPTRLLIATDRLKKSFEKLSHESGTSFSGPVTLIFLNSDIETFFRNVSLTFNVILIGALKESVELVKLYEIYRVETGFPTKARFIGNWSLQSGIKMDPRSVFARRYSFDGKVFRTGSTEKWPFTTFTGFLEKDESYDGLYFSVWRQLGRLLNFTSVHLKGNVPGIEVSEGKWNGLVGKLVNKEIEVIVSELRLTKERLAIMDFTYPLISSWYQIYFKPAGYHLEWTAVFKPFDFKVWLCIFSWVVIGTLCFFLSFYVCCKYGLEGRTKANATFGLLEAFFFIMRTLSLQGCPSIPTSIVCRIIFLTAYLTAGVLMPSYSASLISSLTSQVPMRPFNSLEELLKDGTYKLLVENNTAEFTYFSRAREKTLKSIHHKIMEPIPIAHYTNYSSYGLEMLCEKKNVALFEIQQVMRMKGLANCRLLALTEPLTKVEEGMAFLKGNPFAPYIHHHVHRMTEAGLVRRLSRRVKPMISKELAVWNPVKVEDVFQILTFLAFGIFLSICTLIGEIVVSRKNHRS